jgi:uncharacterized protein (DUF302 family)
MRLLFILLLAVSFSCFAGEQALVVDIEKTVVKKQLEEGVSLEDAVESMKLRANILNIKLVAELPLSKQIKAMGESSQHIAIYQFCDPLTAKKMVEYDINFAAYLPCRITLVEDKKGQAWLVMMNLDILLAGSSLNPELRKEGIRVRDILMEIMDAGVSGAL